MSPADVRDLGGGVRCLVTPNPGPLTLDGTRVYLAGEREAVLIDPGPDLPGQLDRLRELAAGRRVAGVCLTHAHADHAGIAARAARELGAGIRASAGTLRRTGLPGEPLVDGDVLRLDRDPRGLVALEAPGHTADGLCFLRPADGTLFTGDAVLGRGTAVILHPDGAVGAYLATLARLIALRPRRILPGHGDPVEDAVERLEEYRRHRLARGREVEEALRAGARSVSEIRRRVYGDLDPALERAAEASVRAHLAYLAELARSGSGLPPIPGMEEEAGPTGEEDAGG